MRQFMLAGTALLVFATVTPATANGPYLEPATFGTNRDYVTITAAHGAEVAFQPMGPMRTLGDYFATSPDGVTTNIGAGQVFKGLGVVEPAMAKDGTYRISTGERAGRTQKSVKVDGVWRQVRVPPPPGAPGGGGGRGGPEGGRGGPEGGRGPEGAPVAAAPAPAPAGRPQQIDEKDIPAGAEVAESTSYLRAETYVTRGAPTKGALAPTNKGFELAPQTHPNEIFAGDTFKFSLLNDGAGVSGVEYTIRRAGDVYTDGMFALTGSTDAKGVAAAKIPGAGRYILETSYPGNAAPGEKPNPKSTSYSLTFEVSR